MDPEELERVWALYARRAPRKTVERMYVIVKCPPPPRLPPPPPAGLDAPTERIVREDKALGSMTRGRITSRSGTGPESDDS